MSAIPFFLSVGVAGDGAARFGLYHPPAPHLKLRGCVVYIHPFAEEMNFSRRMASLQARGMAAEGFAVLQMDLFGCGDSAGDFSEASWATWVADVVAAARWLGARHGLAANGPNQGGGEGGEGHEGAATAVPLIFWGLRAGCLLAVEAARAIYRPVSFLFWQPVFSGEQYWRQFQRLGLATRVMAGVNPSGASAVPNDPSLDLQRDVPPAQAGAGAAGLDQRAAFLLEKQAHEHAHASEAGHLLELSGYRISPVLSMGLCAAHLTLPVNTQHVACVELDQWAGEGQPPAFSPALATALSSWRAQNLQVSAAGVAGAPFWQIAEAADCPALCAASMQLVQKMQGDLSSALSPGLSSASSSSAPSGAMAASVHASASLDLPATVSFSAGARTETALTFPGAIEHEGPMVGVLTQPVTQPLPQPLARRTTGVLILVGGRQYRAGSHRQFVLLSRRLASADFSSLRFDFHGMGDSSGEPQSFTALDADISAALAAFKAQCPHLQHVVIWGLCDAATAALLYWQRTQGASKQGLSITGLCLVNPWLRTDASLARARVKHYYVERLFAGDFWRKLFSGGVDLFPAVKEYVTQWHASRRLASADFIRDSLDGLRRFPGQLLVVLSGRDLVAKEFMAMLAAEGDAKLLDGATRYVQTIANADHTFSQSSACDQLEVAVLAWLSTFESS
ncbi:MAG: hypothetical protein RugAbin2_02366 [Rugosibacter sp.]|jgi:exosortase A-associated hydrolase 1|nr:hypothetical protein [Rugosibacter sp.]